MCSVRSTTPATPHLSRNATTLKPAYPHSGLVLWASRRWGGENESKSGLLSSWYPHFSSWYPYCVDRSAVSRTGHPPVFELLSTAFEQVFHWWVVVSSVGRRVGVVGGCVGCRMEGRER